jgi:tetratricopeptide (TPR) repeat protein
MNNSEQNKNPDFFPHPASFVRPSLPPIGREETLAVVRQQLCAGPARLALVGPSGIGKSHLAHTIFFDAALREHFCGGVFAIAPGPQSAMAWLQQWEAQAGLAPDPALSPHEQVLRLAATIEQRGDPCLWVIDDVWSAEDGAVFQVQSQLLSMLFTSKHQAVLEEGADVSSSIPIEPLAREQAVAVLCAYAEIPASEGGEALEMLAGLVGGVPLLLKLMGRYLRARWPQMGTQTFEQAFEDLKQAATRMGLPTSPIEQAQRRHEGGGLLSLLRGKSAGSQAITPLHHRIMLELSVGTLPRQMQADIIRLTTLPPDPLSFDVETATEVAEPADPHVFRDLVEHGLLSEVTGGRFVLPALLCAWAEAEKNHYGEVRHGRRRLTAWHTSLLKSEPIRRFLVWQQHPDNVQQLLITLREARADREMLRLCLQQMTQYLIEGGYHREVREGLEEALQVFRDDSTMIGGANYQLGRIAFLCGEEQRAREYVQAALLHFQIAHQEREEAFSLFLLGYIEQEARNDDAARECFEACLALFDDLDEEAQTTSDDYITRAVCRSNLASLLHKQGAYAKARSLYEQVLAWFEQKLGPDHPSTVACRRELASLPWQQEQPEPAPAQKTTTGTPRNGTKPQRPQATKRRKRRGKK